MCLRELQKEDEQWLGVEPGKAGLSHSTCAHVTLFLISTDTLETGGRAELGVYEEHRLDETHLKGVFL